MIVLPDMISIPTRTILVDLASRSSKSLDTELSMCPYPGLADDKEVLNYSKKLNRGLAILFKESSKIPDYTVNSNKPISGKYFLRDHTSVTDFYKELERIDSSWVYKYFKNSIVTLKKSLSKDKEENQDFETPQVFFDEEGEVQSPGDFLIDDISGDRTSDSKERMAYILKMFNEKSISVGVHMFSIVRAYHIVNLRNLSKQLTKRPGVDEMQGEGIYRVDKAGNITIRVISAYTNKMEKEALEIVRSRYESHDGFNDLMEEFIYLCDELGVNLLKEDPRDFDSSFINSMVVTYIKSNRDYIISSTKDANKKVLKTLDKLSVNDYGKIISKSNVRTYADIISSTMDKFKFTDIISRELKGASRLCDVQDFVFKLDKVERKGLYLPIIPTQDGFFMKNQYEPYILNVGRIVKGEESIQALLHISGYLILITPGLWMVYIDLDLANEYLDAVIDGTEDKAYIQYGGNNSNLRFGGWKKSII